MRMGVKTLLYRAGSEACFLVGDRVLPISKALFVSGAAAGSKLVAFGFGEAAEGPICGDGFSGSKAAPGSFSDDGAPALYRDVPSSGGLLAMLP
jgi:hypothetical protein